MHAKNLVGGLALWLLAACGNAASEGLYGDPGEADPEPRDGTFSGPAEASADSLAPPPPPSSTAAPGIDASSPDAGAAGAAGCDDERDKPGKGKGKGKRPDPSAC